LVLRASCETSQLDLKARSRYDHALLHANLQKLGDSPAAIGVNDFNSGSANEINLRTNLAGGDLDSTAGQIIYARPGGINVTIDFLAEEGSPFGDKDCAFTGNAAVVGSGSSSRVNFRSTAGVGQDKIFYENGGLRLVQAGAASCGAVSPTIEVSARTKVENAMVAAFAQYPAIGVTASADPDFDPGSGDETDLTTPPADFNSSGHLVYSRSGGRNISVDYAAHEEVGLFDGTKNCAFVGSARRADSGSSHRVNFRPAGDQALTTFFQDGGLILQGSCASGELVVNAKTNVDTAAIHLTAQQPVTGHDYDESDTFNTGDTVAVFGPTAAFDSSAGGQIVYSRPGGVNVTVDWHGEEGGQPLGGTKSCAFVGTAEKNKP
jgi:hypothetical protein